MKTEKDNITKIREQKNISINEMAATLNLSPGKYQFYENHNAEIPLDIWIKMCEVFDMVPTDFSKFDFANH